LALWTFSLSKLQALQRSAAGIATDHCGSTWSQTFSYDPFGNLSKSGTQSFQPVYYYSGQPITNRYIPFTGFTATYDANGNATADPQNTYQRDAYGRPVVMDGLNLTYDALGRMVEQNSGSNYDEIAYTPAGAKLALMSGQTLVKAFVALPAGAQAVYTPSGGQASLAYYRHADWLGSSRLASTPNRTMYSDTAIAPFGETYAQAGAVDVSYTGQNQDTAAGDYDFPDREYGATSGRWPSPDPAGVAAVDPSDPQTWNRYAYVRNSPVDAVDPLGLDCWGIQETYMNGGQVVWQGIIASWCDGGGGGGGGGGTGISSPLAAGPPPPVPCTLSVTMNNQIAGLNGSLTAIENQVNSALGPYVNVDFGFAVTTPNTLTITNLPTNMPVNGGNTDDLGDTIGAQGSQQPFVWYNRITANFPGASKSQLINVIGTVGAHELWHAVTGLPEELYTQNPTDNLMSLGDLALNAPGGQAIAQNLLLTNETQLSFADQIKLWRACEKQQSGQ